MHYFMNPQNNTKKYLTVKLHFTVKEAKAYQDGAVESRLNTELPPYKRDWAGLLGLKKVGGSRQRLDTEN